jgi:hypothetical protein
MFSLEGCVYKDKVRTEVLVKVVDMCWSTSENTEYLRHSLALSTCEVQISPISFGDRFLYKCWPNLNSLVYLFTFEEKKMFATYHCLDWDKIINYYISPYSVLAYVYAINTAFVGLLPSEQLENSSRLFCEYGESAIDIGIRVLSH